MGAPMGMSWCGVWVGGLDAAWSEDRLYGLNAGQGLWTWDGLHRVLDTKQALSSMQ